jgi:hypothetical protein
MKKRLFTHQLFRLLITNCPLLIARCLLPIAYFLLSFSASAQVDSLVHPTKHKIAIFAPLYLDSAFDATQEYRYAKNTFPKFFNSGLEFYEGAQLALDSLSKEGKMLEVFIYDTRSAKETLEDQLNKAELNEVELILAHCTGNEVGAFAAAGLKKNIPVINVTVPQDGGVTGNPFFVILNPTLRTECEGIYKYIQKYYAIEPTVVFRKKGELENQIKSYWDEYGKITRSVPLKLKYIDLPDSFTVEQLKPHLDSVTRTLCISGSLDINFGRRLAQQLASLNSQYHTVIMGMPTWDNIRDFSRPEFKGPEIVYSTPFYNPRTDKAGLGINNYFTNVMYARPSDMLFRGYEVIWKFARMLLQYGKDVSSNLGNKQFKLFTDFDIQPVINKQTNALDYFENKKLYFLKWQDGIIRGVN